jgi:hypothetical protein
VDWQLFAGVPAEDLRRLLAIARRRTFARGEIVFHRGDPANALHLVAKGRFAVRITTPLAETATLAVRGPGEAFGELALVSADEPLRSATVQAPMAYGFGYGVGGLATARARVPGETATLVGSGELNVAGLRLTMVRDELVSYFGPESRDGLLVLEASDDWSDLRAGDVILRVNGRKVRDGDRASLSIPTGRDVELEILRKGEVQRVTASRP